MQISKLLPAICVVAFCAGFVSARADDTPAQAAARAELEAKMNEANAQSSQPGNQKQSAIFVPYASTNSATGVQAEKSADTNNIDAAEQALHAKMAELDAQGTNVQTPVPAPAPVTPADSEAIAKAKAALEQKMAVLDQQSAKPPATAPMAVAPTPEKPVAPEAPPVAEKHLNPANMNYPGKELGFKPIEAPPLPVSAEVQAQLRTLDAKYMANQITPEEYHKQRAEILNGQ